MCTVSVKWCACGVEANIPSSVPQAQGNPPCRFCAALTSAASSSSQTPHSEPAVCHVRAFRRCRTGVRRFVGAGLTRWVPHQFLDMLEQSFAHESQQTGARPAGRELYVTPNQMNLGVGSPSAYPLFAGYVRSASSRGAEILTSIGRSRAQQPPQAAQPTPTTGECVCWHRWGCLTRRWI